MEKEVFDGLRNIALEILRPQLPFLGRNIGPDDMIVILGTARSCEVKVFDRPTALQVAREWNVAATNITEMSTRPKDVATHWVLCKFDENWIYFSIHFRVSVTNPSEFSIN